MTTTSKVLSASLSRRRLLKAGAATAAGLAAPSFFVRNAWAAGKAMQIGIWGGVQGEFIRKQVLPGFEKDFDCKVDAQQGSTLGQIALLRAGKDAPKFTVMFVDDLGVEIAKREGLIDPLPKDKMPNLAKVYPRFIYNDGYGVALAISSAGLFYNPQATKPLESYAELWDRASPARSRWSVPRPRRACSPSSSPPPSPAESPTRKRNTSPTRRGRS